MTWLLELAYPKPPEGLSANSRAHWRVKARSTATVRAQVKYLAWAAGIEPMQRCGVTVTWVVADRRRRDEDNLAPLCKAIFDGLGADKGVSAGIVPDDDPAHMVKAAPVIEYRAGATPHFEVAIVDLSNTFRPDPVQAVVDRLENE